MPEPTHMLASESLDSADLDSLQELEQSPGYALFAKRINEQIQRQCAALELPQSEQMTANLRGNIWALRLVLEIPSILKGEVKTEIEDGNRNKR